MYANIVTFSVIAIFILNAVFDFYNYLKFQSNYSKEEYKVIQPPTFFLAFHYASSIILFIIFLTASYYSDKNFNLFNIIEVFIICLCYLLTFIINSKLYLTKDGVMVNGGIHKNKGFKLPWNKISSWEFKSSKGLFILKYQNRLGKSKSFDFRVRDELRDDILSFINKYISHKKV
ncbi:hypothetical protein CPJCM30710_16750 [Clostridium polyendosporum]|uniref:Uncharacterized protein n=1 Tax=Clostridium polyendosporum TaxID=69208 RepID=A0A919VEC6_9CLOT|nr:hypothetical protein [Clostridium polyendosporum]GIM29009.1 hypothetical protein CPJCM30710_16750 [Clostridium polyendosporum]